MNARHQEVLIQLTHILRLVKREDEHLQAVRQRLFGSADEISKDWVAGLLKSPEGIDRLESFGAKFGRMQDTIVDKLLPRLLQAAGENPGTAIDNLGRAERLRLIGNADEWIAMRGLRNLLVHEYIESPSEMLAALQQARDFTGELHDTFRAVSEYAQTHLNVSLAQSAKPLTTQH